MLTLSTKSTVRAAALAALLLPCAMPHSNAQVLLTLKPNMGGANDYTVTQGGTFELDATLLNTDPVNSFTVDSYSFMGTPPQDVSASSPPPAAGDVFIDDGTFATPFANNLFYNNFNQTFAPGNGTAINTPMFVFTFGSAVPTGLYTVSLFLNDASGNSLAQAMFTFNVQAGSTSSVPEPGAVAMLLGMLTTGGLLARRRK